MKSTWKSLGIALAVIVLLIVSFAWRLFVPYGGNGMMGYEYGWPMPMMYGGYGMMGFGMLFMWLISLASLLVIGLGIAWLGQSAHRPK